MLNQLPCSVLLFLMLLSSGCSNTQVGQRPAQLVQAMPNTILAQQLHTCLSGPARASKFSISHRGAPLGYPEHTRQGYIAAAEMGAGIIECDVTFTADLQLVCRHAQCDLHSTTNILQTPLAQKCTQPFTPATGDQAATAQCCTSDISLAEFKTLCGRHDVINPRATSVDQYLSISAARAEQIKTLGQPVQCGTLMTHAESISLIDELGADFTPELKTPAVTMPFKGLSQTDFADAMVREYEAAGITPDRVYPQSFLLSDVQHWITQHPAFGERAIFLDARGRNPAFQPSLEGMRALKDAGVNIVAPPMPQLLALDRSVDPPVPVASAYARLARQAGLDIITWTLERGSATDPGNWLYMNLRGYMTHEAKMFEVLHALHTQVGIKGIFSDWPGTVTFYANCFELP